MQAEGGVGAQAGACMPPRAPEELLCGTPEATGAAHGPPPAAAAGTAALPRRSAAGQEVTLRATAAPPPGGNPPPLQTPVPDQICPTAANRDPRRHCAPDASGLGGAVHNAREDHEMQSCLPPAQRTSARGPADACVAAEAAAAAGRSQRAGPAAGAGPLEPDAQVATGADGASPRRHAFVRGLPRRVQAAVANACMRFAAMAAFREEERLLRKVVAHLHHRCGSKSLPPTPPRAARRLWPWRRGLWQWRSEGRAMLLLPLRPAALPPPVRAHKSSATLCGPPLLGVPLLQRVRAL